MDRDSHLQVQPTQDRLRGGSQTHAGAVAVEAVAEVVAEAVAAVMPSHISALC